MFRSTKIQIYILPVAHYIATNKLIGVIRIHITKVVSATSCKTRHSVQLKSKHLLVIYQALVYHLMVLFVPSP